MLLATGLDKTCMLLWLSTVYFTTQQTVSVTEDEDGTIRQNLTSFTSGDTDVLQTKVQKHGVSLRMQILCINAGFRWSETSLISSEETLVQSDRFN
jgi:hypothetical protein